VGASAIVSTVPPVRASSVAAMSVVSPRVALMSRNWAWGRARSGTCQAQPRWGSAKKWNSSIAMQPMSASSPRRRASLARISAVQQMIGASVLIVLSPVIMPTFSRPKMRTNWKNFSLTSALIGAV
jgi:hypothetical protein